MSNGRTAIIHILASPSNAPCRPANAGRCAGSCCEKTGMRHHHAVRNAVAFHQCAQSADRVEDILVADRSAGLVFALDDDTCDTDAFEMAFDENVDLLTTKRNVGLYAVAKDCVEACDVSFQLGRASDPAF